MCLCQPAAVINKPYCQSTFTYGLSRYAVPRTRTTHDSRVGTQVTADTADTALQHGARAFRYNCKALSWIRVRRFRLSDYVVVVRPSRILCCTNERMPVACSSSCLTECR